MKRAAFDDGAIKCEDVDVVNTMDGPRSDMQASTDSVSPAGFLVTVHQPMGRMNGEAGVTDGYRIRLSLSEMKRGYQARVLISNEKKDTYWCIGTASGMLVGVSITSISPNVPLNIRSFLINCGEFLVSLGEDCEKMEALLYVKTGEQFLRGTVDLPQGGIATLESTCDRVNLLKESSFSLALC